LPETLFAVSFVTAQCAEVDVERRRLRALDAPASDLGRGRDVRAIFQTYGRTWLAMARMDSRLVLVSPQLSVPLPSEPLAGGISWRRRRLVYGELAIHRSGVCFRYRLPSPTLLTRDPFVGTEYDLAYWIYWRLRESHGLRDWAERTDWSADSWDESGG